MVESRTQAIDLRDRLLRDVLYGRLPPGEKLKIEVLQERYGAGATPLREALNLLVSTGLVERLEQRGFRVAEIGMEQFEEILWTRSFIEERALRESIAHGDAQWEERLVLSLYHLRKFPSEGTAGEEGAEVWERLHAKFHSDLISGCPSKLLLRYCAELYDANGRYRHIARLSPRSRSDALNEHEQIGNAALARDADTAARLLIEHYNRTGDLLRNHLRQQKQPA